MTRRSAIAARNPTTGASNSTRPDADSSPTHVHDVCWICGSSDTTIWKQPSIDRPLAPADLRITDARYGLTLRLTRCHRCHFIFAVGSNLSQLPALYEGLTDPGYLNSEPGRRQQMHWLVQAILRQHPTARTLLDVGAGTGLLVGEAIQQGLMGTGVEPSTDMVEHARASGIDLLQGRVPHERLIGRTFDVVTLVDVIEHVTDPVPLLTACASMLNPGGVILVVTPDIGSVAARALGTRWWHFRLAHVGYFNASSLATATTAAGLRVISTFRPKWFFRVRYLAERVARYLPIRPINRVARRFPLLRRLYDRVVPLNVYDSIGVFLRRAEPK